MGLVFYRYQVYVVFAVSHSRHTEVPSNIKETTTEQSIDCTLTVDKILQYKTVQYWLEGLSANTKRNYMKHFPLWLELTKNQLGTDNPDKLIEMFPQYYTAVQFHQYFCGCE